MFSSYNKVSFLKLFINALFHIQTSDPLSRFRHGRWSGMNFPPTNYTPSSQVLSKQKQPNSVHYVLYRSPFIRCTHKKVRIKRQNQAAKLSVKTLLIKPNLLSGQGSSMAISSQASRIDTVLPRVSVGPSWHVGVRDHLDGLPGKRVYQWVAGSMYPTGRLLHPPIPCCSCQCRS